MLAVKITGLPWRPTVAILVVSRYVFHRFLETNQFWDVRPGIHQFLKVLLKDVKVSQFLCCVPAVIITELPWGGFYIILHLQYSGHQNWKNSQFLFSKGITLGSVLSWSKCNLNFTKLDKLILPWLTNAGLTGSCYYDYPILEWLAKSNMIIK